MEPSQASQSLPQGAIRLREVLFQSVAAMAPAGVAFPIVAGSGISWKEEAVARYHTD
jgi:hypothetical protein